MQNAADAPNFASTKVVAEGKVKQMCHNHLAPAIIFVKGYQFGGRLGSFECVLKSLMRLKDNIDMHIILARETSCTGKPP